MGSGGESIAASPEGKRYAQFLPLLDIRDSTSAEDILKNCAEIPLFIYLPFAHPAVEGFVFSNERWPAQNGSGELCLCCAGLGVGKNVVGAGSDLRASLPACPRTSCPSTPSFVMITKDL